jgi:hypothetical protein
MPINALLPTATSIHIGSSFKKNGLFSRGATLHEPPAFSSTEPPNQHITPVAHWHTPHLPSRFLRCSFLSGRTSEYARQQRCLTALQTDSRYPRTDRPDVSQRLLREQ